MTHQKLTPEQIEELLADEPLTLSEAREIAKETLKIGNRYFEQFIRPKLNPRALLVKSKAGEKPELGGLKLLTSELRLVLAQIKKDFKDR